jgi:hypothetical protein
MMLKKLSIFALVLSACGASLTQADATFSYELSGSDDKKTVKQFSIARFFVRVDDPSEEKQFLLFQAGRFFPVYAVDEAESTYTLLTPPANPRLGPVSPSKPVAPIDPDKDKEKAADAVADEDTQPQASGEQPGAEEPAKSEAKTESAATADPVATADPMETPEIEQEPASPEPGAPDPNIARSTVPAAEAAGSEATPAPPPAQPVGRLPPPTLKPTRKMRNIAGIRCRVVHELRDGEAVMEHCMANSAALGVTKREVITLSRMFSMSRKMDLDWLGTGTRDEEFVAVYSRDLGDNRVLQLTSVSTKPLPAGHLKIPRSFKLVESDAPSESAAAGKAD